MNKNKLLGILEGAVIIALGVLIAIFGFATVVDIYFGIVAIIVGAALLGVSIYSMIKKTLTFGLLGLGTILIAIGIGLLVHQLSFGVLIPFVVFAVLGYGAALIIYGIYLLARKYTIYGVLVLVIGILLVTFAVLYLTVPEFQKAFWIAVGVSIALYGVLYIVFILTDKKAITKK